jgi:hypothetical protein
MAHKSLARVSGRGDGWADEEGHHHCASEPEGAANNMNQTKNNSKVLHDRIS